MKCPARAMRRNYSSWSKHDCARATAKVWKLDDDACRWMRVDATLMRNEVNGGDCDECGNEFDMLSHKCSSCEAWKCEACEVHDTCLQCLGESFCTPCYGRHNHGAECTEAAAIPPPPPHLLQCPRRQPCQWKSATPPPPAPTLRSTVISRRGEASPQNQQPIALAVKLGERDRGTIRRLL